MGEQAIVYGFPECHIIQPNCNGQWTTKKIQSVSSLDSSLELEAYVTGCGRTVNPPLLHDFRRDSADMIVLPTANTQRVGMRGIKDRQLLTNETARSTKQWKYGDSE